MFAKTAILFTVLATFTTFAAASNPAPPLPGHHLAPGGIKNSCNKGGSHPRELDTSIFARDPGAHGGAHHHHHHHHGKRKFGKALGKGLGAVAGHAVGHAATIWGAQQV